MQKNDNPRVALRRLLTHIDGAYAPNTLRAYKTDMFEFIRYCETHEKHALEATPQVVAQYLTDISNHNVKSSTIRRKMASISAFHRLQNKPDPTKDSEVRLAIRKINRRLGTRCDQAYPINAGTLRILLDGCDQSLRGMRNRALLTVAYESMARRAELVSLQVEDLRRTQDSSSVVYLRRSKTDQTGNGKYIQLSENATLLIQEWLHHAGIQTGALFRGVRSNGELTASLDASRISRIYKQLAMNAGIGPEVYSRISGHSTRVGAAQDLVKRGASMPEIMLKGGWTKPDTVMRYVQGTNAPLGNLSELASQIEDPEKQAKRQRKEEYSSALKTIKRKISEYGISA